MELRLPCIRQFHGVFDALHGGGRLDDFRIGDARGENRGQFLVAGHAGGIGLAFLENLVALGAHLLHLGIQRFLNERAEIPGR